MKTTQTLSKTFDEGKVNQSIFSATSDEFKMTIDPQSMQHIISRLTDLYEDPIKATVREIISNAIDATQHIEPENRKPIDITTPGTFQHEFVVTDHALGLTLDEVKNIYTRYGASTKRTDFTQIGAYGLGSKSPLSYTSSFNVRTAKDGYETELLISIEDGKNNVKVVSHEQTDKDNYMTVAVPVREDDATKFEEALETYVLNPVEGIEFNGLDAIAENIKNDSYTFSLGQFDYEGITLGLRYRYGKRRHDTVMDTDSVRETLYTLRCASDDDTYRRIHATLLGYEYDLDSESARYDSGAIIVDLVPGLVDFSSSRDNITNTPRKNKLVEFVKNYIHDNNDKLIHNLIKGINAMENSDVVKYEIFDDRVYLANILNNLNDEELSELGKLSNGKSLYDDRDKLTVLVQFNQDADYGYNHINGLRYNANAFNIKQILSAYFNPTQYIQSYYRHDTGDEPTEAELTEYATTDIVVKSPLRSNQTTLFITDIKDENEGAKVVSLRNLLSGNHYVTPDDTVKYNRFVLTDKTKADMQKIVDEYFFALSDKISVLSYDEVTELGKTRRKEFTSLRKRSEKNASSKPDVRYKYVQQFNGINNSIEGFTSFFVSSLDDVSKDTDDYLRIARVDNFGVSFNDLLTVLSELTKQNKKGITIYDYNASDLRANSKELFDKFDLIFAKDFYNIRSKVLRDYLKERSTHEQVSELTFTDRYSDIAKKQITAYNISRQVANKFNSYEVTELHAFKNLKVLFNVSCPELFAPNTEVLHLKLDDEYTSVKLNNAPVVLNKSTDELVDLFKKANEYKNKDTSSVIVTDEMLPQYLAHEYAKQMLK